MTTLLVKPRRVGIIGTGHVGSHVAFSLATQGLVDELRLVDTDAAKAKGHALDIEDAVSYLPHHVEATVCAAEELNGCDVIVLCAGLVPQPGESRLDELPRTMTILRDIIPRLRRLTEFHGVLLCITNPADVVAAFVQHALDLPPSRILSTGTCLDSARLQALLGAKLGISRASLYSAYVLGEHGDSSMIAWSHICVGPKALDELQQENGERFPCFDKDKMLKDVRERGFVLLNGKGCTEFGIATSAAEVIRAIFHNERKVLPCSVLLHGQYGENGVFASTPVIIGAAGVEEVMELRLTEDELAAFKKSCGVIRDYLNRAKALGDK